MFVKYNWDMQLVYCTNITEFWDEVPYDNIKFKILAR